MFSLIWRRDSTKPDLIHSRQPQALQKPERRVLLTPMETIAVVDAIVRSKDVVVTATAPTAAGCGTNAKRNGNTGWPYSTPWTRP